MTNEKSDLTRESIEAHIVEKAMKEPDFRQRLLENPKTALSEELTIFLGENPSFPDTLTINVVEESDDNLYLVLPAALASSAELTDAQLAGIAGGLGKGGRGFMRSLSTFSSGG
jgi:hypothetical protein